MSSNIQQLPSSTPDLNLLFPDVPRFDYHKKLKDQPDIRFIKGQEEDDRADDDDSDRYYDKCDYRFKTKIYYKGLESHLKIYTHGPNGQKSICRELTIYQHLQSRDCPIIPKIQALVTVENHVIGFISRHLGGKDALSMQDLEQEKNTRLVETCRKGLHILNGYGVAHGDVFGMLNIRIIEGNAWFYDFETSIIETDDPEGFEKECQDDLVNVGKM